jgi:hypothetical protein
MVSSPRDNGVAITCEITTNCWQYSCSIGTVPVEIIVEYLFLKWLYSEPGTAYVVSHRKCLLNIS